MSGAGSRTGLRVVGACAILTAFAARGPLARRTAPGGVPDPTGRYLYLLAGTPTLNSPASFPVTLYTVGQSMRLRTVRRIAGPGEGLFSVYVAPGTLFVVFPHITSTTVSVISEAHPRRRDVVRFNPGGAAVDETGAGVAVAAGQAYALLPLISRTGRRELSVSLASVPARASPGGRRFGEDRWALYRRFRFYGQPGGAVGPETVPTAVVRSGRLVDQLSPPGRPPFRGQPAAAGLALAPRVPSAPVPRRRGCLCIVFDTRRFLAIAPPPPAALYLLDRRRQTWRVFRSAATVPYARRIFGAWMATIVESWRPGDRANEFYPGLRSQRDWGNRLLPNVQSAFAFWRARDAWVPGVLTLDNLADGRHVAISTHQADSEILDVRRDGLVLYRVNDEIFRARIEGEKLSAPKLVVKGDDVPEVHWVFWSSAPPRPPAAAAPPARKH